MLLRYSLSNFMSIRDFQELSMVASSLSDDQKGLIEAPGLPHKLLRIAAIYGPNASGKSNVLYGLRFMRNAVKYSQNRWEPSAKINRRPFVFDGYRERPSELAVDILLNNVRYEYGFAFNDSRITQEYLYAYPGNRRQRWFERNTDKGPIVFGKQLTGENRAIENLTRPNSLFLSAAAQNNHEKLRPIYDWFNNHLVFRSGLDVGSSTRQTIEMCARDEEVKQTVLKLLSAADLGIVGMDIEEEEKDPKMEAFTEKLESLLKEFIPDVSSSSEEEAKAHTVSFRHRGQGDHTATIPLSDQSEGTRSFLAMLGPAIQVLAFGGVLCVDELDASLHPLLVREIVKIFNRPESNPKGAQLIFTTHNTDLLGDDVLRRDQIWFTEKENTGATRLYPLSDFKPRKDENLQRGYLQGRYGATPFIRAIEALEK